MYYLYHYVTKPLCVFLFVPAEIKTSGRNFSCIQHGKELFGPSRGKIMVASAGLQGVA